MQACVSRCFSSATPGSRSTLNSGQARRWLGRCYARTVAQTEVLCTDVAIRASPEAMDACGTRGDRNGGGATEAPGAAMRSAPRLASKPA